jgi:hypothetical protein
VTILQRLEMLLPLTANADHVDVKTGEGELSLREFLSGLFSYAPGWVRQLYRVRGALAKVLGLQHEPYEPKRIRPEDVPFKPGELVRFFPVKDAREEEYWIALAGDRHLEGAMAVLVEPLGGKRRRFHVFTVVKYKHWTGRLYFNLIRPFHHLLAAAMVRAGLRGAP